MVVIELESHSERSTLHNYGGVKSSKRIGSVALVTKAGNPCPQEGHEWIHLPVCQIDHAWNEGQPLLRYQGVGRWFEVGVLQFGGGGGGGGGGGALWDWVLIIDCGCLYSPFQVRNNAQLLASYALHFLDSAEDRCFTSLSADDYYKSSSYLVFSSQAVTSRQSLWRYRRFYW